MCGEIIKKYCSVCKKEVEIHVSSCLIGPAKTENSHGEEYYIGIHCPQCNNHLSKDTEEEVLKLKEKGVDFGVCML